METNKKTRTELKQYFQQGDQPTQQQFADFIDAGLNQGEDGIVKVQGNPLAIQAEGESVGTQEILDLYTHFSKDIPDWSLNLNPRVDPQKPDSNQPGFNIKDTTGQSRLFIKSGNGNIGLGTIEPESKLTIQGKNDKSLLSVIDTTHQHTKIFEVTQENGNGMLSVRNGNNENIVGISGKKETPSFFLNKVGIGTINPGAPLSISGAGKEDSPDESMHITNQTILFGGNNAGKQTNSAKISAGTHTQNSLNIIGMASGTSNTDRKVDIFAEGGMTVRGQIKTQEQYVVAFSVSLSVDASGDKNPLIFGQINYNIGNHFKDNTHFTAPVTGIYLFTISMLNKSTTDGYWRLRLNDTGYVNGLEGDEKTFRASIRSGREGHTASRTIITKLNTNDKVHIEQYKGNNDKSYTGFEGVLLQALI